MNQQLIIQGNCIEYLRKLPAGKVKCIFADVFDNLGMQYNGFEDKMKPEDYYTWVNLLVLEALPKCKVFWLTYYPRHDLEFSWFIRDIIKYRHPSFQVDKFLWRYTFSQYSATDCALGYRPIMRFKRADAIMYPEAIMEQSERQLIGDKRANPEGRVPDNVWDIPRVTGNSWERVDFMPTQLPIKLLEKIMKFSVKDQEIFVDLFGGSGSTLMAAKALSRLPYTSVVELSQGTCENIQKRMGFNDEGQPKVDIIPIESYGWKD